ncbi:loricrin-like [Bacillus rossius redtenbacheri]|uniref:loricrin-like n=1 Tax=Bacillus rossius redtenbacheri TaxID=93214 RepID=UPI002FDDA4B9
MMICKILILAATFMATASHQCDCGGKRFSSSSNGPASSLSDASSSSSSSSDSASSSGGYQGCGCGSTGSDYSSGQRDGGGGGKVGGHGHKHSSSGCDCRDGSDGSYDAWGYPRWHSGAYGDQTGGWGLPWLVLAPGSPGGFHGLHHGGRRHPSQGGQLLWCHPAAGPRGQQLSPAGFGSWLFGWGQPAWGGGNPVMFGAM